jgi:hypothetical protein
MFLDALSITNKLSSKSGQVILEMAKMIESLVIKIQSPRVIKVACKVLNHIIGLEAFDAEKVRVEGDDTFVKRILKRIGQYLLVEDERAKKCIETYVKMKQEEGGLVKKEEEKSGDSQSQSKSLSKSSDSGEKYRVYISLNNVEDD